jgi:hypothetical protein
MARSNSFNLWLVARTVLTIFKKEQKADEML